MDGAVIVPLEHERPIFRIMVAQKAELLNSLIVAEPTSTPGAIGVYRGKKVVFFAPFQTLLLRPPRFDQGASLVLYQIVKSGWFISGYPYVNTICTFLGFSQCCHFQISITPSAFDKGEASIFSYPVAVSAFSLGDFPVEQLMVSAS